jgi:hypothetical protein
MKTHLADSTLALYATGDLDFRNRLAAAWHVRTCARCASIAKSFETDILFRRESAASMPLPSNWDELADEMAANIRLGLSAAECIRDVQPRRENRLGELRRPALRSEATAAGRPGWFWKPAAGISAAMAVVLTVWIGSMPPEQTRVFSRVWDAVAHGRPAPAERPYVVLESSAQGIEMRQGSRTSLKVLVMGQNPDQFSANLDGSMRAQYVDDQSGQVTVTNVYAQ